MAAKLAMSGDLKRFRHFCWPILWQPHAALQARAEFNESADRLVWNTAARLATRTLCERRDGYRRRSFSFLKARVPCVDVIDLENSIWHYTAGYAG
jgi:hypothetical protein